MVLRGFPIGKRGQLLRDRLEQSNNDADRSRFHVGTEFINRSSVLVSSISKARTNFLAGGGITGETHRSAVMAVELHFLPDSQKNRS